MEIEAVLEDLAADRDRVGDATGSFASLTPGAAVTLQLSALDPLTVLAIQVVPPPPSLV